MHRSASHCAECEIEEAFKGGGHGEGTRNYLNSTVTQIKITIPSTQKHFEHSEDYKMLGHRMHSQSAVIGIESQKLYSGV